MQSRLQQLLEYKNISPARFAQIIGVQRSAVSHILSGRNNPSLDFLRKIIENFPDVNSEWLITGQGSILKDHLFHPINVLDKETKGLFENEEDENNDKVEKVNIDDKKEEEEIEMDVDDEEEEEEVDTDDEMEENIEKNTKKSEESYPEETENNRRFEKEDTSTNGESNRCNPPLYQSNNMEIVTKKTTIERIVVLQDDGTFKDYLPEKK